MNVEKQQYISVKLDFRTKWIIPFAVCFIAFVVRSVITDVSTQSYIWDKDAAYLIEKSKSLVILIANSFIYVFVCQYIICHYAARKRRITEYLLIFVYTIITLNALQLISSFFLNENKGFNVVSFVRTNAIGIPIAMFCYFYLRSKIFSAYYAQQSLQIEKIKSQQFSTELDYLKAQYHPHFLFNALNTVYFQIEEQNESAKRTVELLSSLLRYQIYDIKNQVTLEQEIEHLKNYIEFQKMRMSERLKFDLSINANQQQKSLHPLLFQPLIENAFKYVRGETMRISCRIEQTPTAIQFAVQNTIDAQTANNTRKGVGIGNLKRRLELLYPQKHTLNFEHNNDYFKATLTIHTNN